jgi:hypothetical protein
MYSLDRKLQNKYRRGTKSRAVPVHVYEISSFFEGAKETGAEE